MLDTLMPLFIRLLEKISITVVELGFGDSVKYGSTIKLKHVDTKCTLHSHDISYKHKGSSQQQQVTAWEGSDHNDYWVVKGPHNLPENYKENQPVRHGDPIRLQHLSTKRNLHSHWDIKSPLSQQQEVTAFGENGIGNDEDNWRAEVQYGKIWYENIQVKLIHVSTNHALHSHNGHRHSEYTSGQQEVTAFVHRNDDDWWVVTK